MIVASDTSPVLNLAAIGQAQLLERLFGEIVIPTAVGEEVRRLRSSRRQFSSASLPPFVREIAVTNVALSAALKVQVHEGEAEAIALAAELKADWLLLDEHEGRKVATKLGLKTMGCLGILHAAKQAGFIDAMMPIMDRLESEAGFWIGRALREQVLKDIAE